MTRLPIPLATAVALGVASATAHAHHSYGTFFVLCAARSVRVATEVIPAGCGRSALILPDYFLVALQAVPVPVVPFIELPLTVPL